MIIILNGLVTAYFVWATYRFVDLCNANIWIIFFYICGNSKVIYHTAHREPFQSWPPNDNSTADFGVCKNPCELSKPVEIGYCPGYCGMEWCDGYGLLLILFVLTYLSLFYYHIIKPYFGSKLYGTVIGPFINCVKAMLRKR